jgi:ribose transport system ATP-binding protein
MTSSATFHPNGDSPEHPVALGVRGAHKTYGHIHALNDVSISVLEGESAALIGANGAGKSTLVRVLTGAVSLDHGEVILDGHVQDLHSVRDARNLGVGYVPQELNVAPSLTIAENVLAGGWQHSLGFVRTRSSVAQVDEVCERVGLSVSPRLLVGRLSQADQRLVMVARALISKPRSLILDEPTAALAYREAERIAVILNQLRQAGISLIYVSHRMNEIEKLCDVLFVLRDGKVVLSAPATSENVERAVAVGMSGTMQATLSNEATESLPIPQDDPDAALALRCTGLQNQRLRDVTFDVKVGEIVGLAGLLGSGRTEILRAVAGADRCDDGDIEVFGERRRFRSPSDAIAAGVVLIPEDRRNEGGLLGLSIRDNLMLPSIPKRFGGWVRRTEERRLADEAVQTFGIKCETADALLHTLSGGNQQKVIIARWLLTGARVLLMDEPTAGIDVVAKQEIMSLVTDVVHEGRAAVVVSSELSELTGFCDRIYVVIDGRIAFVVDGSISTERLAGMCSPRVDLEVTPKS